MMQGATEKIYSDSPRLMLPHPPYFVTETEIFICVNSISVACLLDFYGCLLLLPCIKKQGWFRHETSPVITITSVTCI